MTRMTPAAVQAMLNGDVSNFIAASTPGAIERSEAAGQARLAKSADRLPVDINYPRGILRSKITEELGITFGKSVDKVFIEATFPEGWKIVPTTHAMWSDLVDAQGRKRAAIFFKAAFYDYTAHISFECRYIVDSYVDVVVNDVKMRKCQVIDKAKNIALWASDPAGERDFNAQDKNREEAAAWLDAQFPKHDDPFAYWND